MISDAHVLMMCFKFWVPFFDFFDSALFFLVLAKLIKTRHDQSGMQLQLNYTEKLNTMNHSVSACASITCLVPVVAMTRLHCPKEHRGRTHYVRASFFWYPFSFLFFLY